jgi:two-component system response regulator RegA
MRIIIVEDDEALRERLARALRERGHDAVTAGDRRAAWEVAAVPFDAAIVDLRLREDSGLDVVSDLVAASPGARILLATGFATPAIVEEASRRGATACIGKPYDTDRLLEGLLKSNTPHRQGDRA